MKLRDADPRVLEVRFNFRTTFQQNSTGGNPLGQHRMRQLACDLVCWVDKRKGEVCKVQVNDVEPFVPPTQRDR